MRVVFLAPRRNDNGHRDGLWKWCKARWQALMPDVPIYEGHHTEGSFNRAAAINKASRLADEDGRWDIGIVIDSDVFLPIPHVRAAIAEAAEGKVTWAHRRWRNVADKHLKRLLADPDPFGDVPAAARDMDLIVDETNPISWSCCVAVPRSTFDDMGGFDERFVGWGFEDGAWAALVRGRYPWARIDGDLYHLNHERSPERIILGQPRSTASSDYIRNALLGRRYMVAAIRDHKAGDQPGEEVLADPMAAIHVANLKTDDEKFLAMARQKGMPEAKWADWWPTLDELAAGAKGERSKETPPSVTVVVTSGGTAETWEARSAYLRESLASIAAHLTGPIVQKVVYSDWEEPFRSQVAAIADEFGFYVSGQGHHGHTGMRQRLWTYLDNRAQGTYVFGAEDDFLFTGSVDLEPMIETLRENPHLAQIALLREPAYQSERDKGGILGWPVDSFERMGQNGSSRLEHVLFWTNNPALYRKGITKTPWPETREDAEGRGKGSEVVFADILRRNPATRFAFWGSGQPVISHIGAERAGTGY